MSEYNYSINIVQGLIAFIEGLLLSMKASKSALLAVIIVVSSAVPPSMNLKNPYNEKLWETIIATIVGGLALNGVYDQGFIREAILSFLVDTSSMAFTDEIYNSIILGGANPNVEAYRKSYPYPSFLNKISLG